jgi:outer membrane protein TolC
VPVGLPSELVRRRPDVREAEARLHAATAATGVAVASFYPDVVLNGMADLNGLAFANAFSLPSGSFQVGPTLSIPLFEGGKLTGQLRLRKSEQRVAAIDFKKTVLHAWQEVDDALTAFAEAQQQRTQTAVAARQNAAALQAARQRYEQGAGDFLNVTASESQLLQSENALATSDTEIATDLVALYRALGGGWQVADTGAVQRSGG